MSTEKNYEAESAPKTVEMVDQKDGAKVPENAEVGTKTEDTTCKGKSKNSRQIWEIEITHTTGTKCWH